MRHDKTRADKYRATRSYYPHMPAREVLRMVRECHPNVKQYPKTSGVYGPWIENGLTRGALRWVENVHDAGLRRVGYSDEITRSVDHQGWFTDPSGDAGFGVMRGTVYQLPARHGRAVYVYGFEDPENENEALLDFSLDAIGEPGGHPCGGYEEASESAALWADAIADRYAEDERDCRLRDMAYQEAEELRDEARSIRTQLCDRIRKERERIQELMDRARTLEDNPAEILYPHA